MSETNNEVNQEKKPTTLHAMPSHRNVARRKLIEADISLLFTPPFLGQEIIRSRRPCQTAVGLGQLSWVLCGDVCAASANFGSSPQRHRVGKIRISKFYSAYCASAVNPAFPGFGCEFVALGRGIFQTGDRGAGKTITLTVLPWVKLLLFLELADSHRRSALFFIS